ncbi:MAG TPA: hypothetical protein VI749_05875, partial [Candidatus Omnitrophota bacterium]|nr:hypothetical protein [Candidatus Omnitrophota bacterium]
MNVILYVIFFILTLFLPFSVNAATLNEVYSPLIEKKDVYSKAQFSSFTMREEGAHGSASFGEFESEPTYFTLKEFVRFSPFDLWEIDLGFGNDFNTTYERFTVGIGTGDTLNKYDLLFMNHYYFDLRRRFKRSEFYLNSYGNRQRAGWNVPLNDDQPNF